MRTWHPGIPESVRAKYGRFVWHEWRATPQPRPVRPVEIPGKTCCRCHRTKPITNFILRPEKPDGRSEYCKGCVDKDWRRPERVIDGARYLYCNGCEEMLPEDRFNKWKRTRAGRYPTCRECRSKSRRAKRQAKEAA